MKAKAVWYVIIAFFLLGVTGCDKEKKTSSICDCANMANVVQYENIEGTVKYDEAFKQWQILYNETVLEDNMKLFIPCDLPNEYKKNNTHVLFSGKSFAVSNSLETQHQKKYLCMALQNIKSIEYALMGIWQLTGFGNAVDNSVKVAEPKDCERCYTLIFKNNETFVGHTSTNEVAGVYRLNDKLVDIVNVGGTERNELMDGKLYVESLLKVFKYEVKDNDLKLFYTHTDYLLYKKR
ncbi:MAG: hypothetical protein Q4G63_05665 [Bacteroidia bacterium]|nr:hypothetical protein [Bacteroidia bacterium]